MIDQALKQKLIIIAKKQISAGVNFKKPRIKQIQKFEDMYANKVAKALKNRFNIPLPILSGFVDTLKAKIDDAPVITFLRREEADTKVAKKVTAMWEIDSGEDRGRWGFIDRLVKMTAIFSGRGIYKIFSESDPIYKNHLEVRDYYDFYCEPQGGPDLEDHMFLGEQNIFRSKKQLIDGAKSGYYERIAVGMLLSTSSSLDQKKTQKDVEQKLNRSRSLGLDANSNNYVGDIIFNLTEHYMVYDGVRYYLLLDESNDICIKAEKLSDMFKTDEQVGDALWPYVSWATHEDNYNFWSKGPCDDVYPVAEAMRIIFNESLNNLYKRNWGMRAFDSNIFTDPSKLEWRPDGLVDANGLKGPIREGIFELTTPDNTAITLNMFQFMDNTLGTKTGINANTQGAGSQDQKVGIFYGEMEQVADRLGLTNKIYKGSWSQLGKRYLYGLQDHLNEKTAVKILGANGIEWDELDKNEITDLNIKVSGGNDEAKFNEVKNQRKIAALDAIATNPNLSSKINPNFVIEEKLKNAGYDAEEIKRALDTNNFGNEDLMVEAAKAIQDIVSGKKPLINRAATSGFMQKIVDFAYDTELDLETFNALIDYATKHSEIAAENMARKAQSIIRERNINTATPSLGNAPINNSVPVLGNRNMANAEAQKEIASSQGVRI